MPRHSYRSLDGHLVTVSGPELDLSLPWSASVQCLAGSSRFGLQSLRKADWAGLMIHHPGFAFSESYLSQGGELRIGSVAVDDEYGDELTGEASAHRVWLGYWQGSEYAVAALARVPQDVRPNFFEWFDNFDISETTSGIELAPRQQGSIEFIASEVVKEIPKLGLLSIVDTRQASTLAPTWKGTPVDGGELYVNDGDKDLSGFYLLVGHTALTTIQPIGDGRLNDPGRLRRVEHLTVTWK
jgi:hypothetical protein